MLLLEADLSQIESRFVFLLSDDPELVRLATMAPYEYDAHTANIVIVGLAKSREEVEKIRVEQPARFKQLRHLGKIVSHGAQRDMRGKTLSDNILKQLGILVPATKCEQYIANYHKRYPGIRERYFREIRRLVMRDRMLVNSWGRRIDFRYDRLDDALFRQAYSFLPQSENADLLNQRGVIPLYRYMMERFGYPPHLQVHDSLLLSVRPEDAYDVARVIESNLTKTLLIGGHKFRPFVEYKLGRDWGMADGVSFNRLPTRREFTDAAFALAEKSRE
jgi:DNA polymerase I-like protein with 3'-5' exonuclease and polymerase domains